MSDDGNPRRRPGAAALEHARALGARAVASTGTAIARSRNSLTRFAARIATERPMLERLTPHQRIVAASVAVAILVGAGLWIALDAVDPLPAKIQATKAPEPPPPMAVPATPAPRPAAAPAPQPNPPANQQQTGAPPLPQATPPQPPSLPAPQAAPKGPPLQPGPRAAISPSIVRQMDTQPLAAVRQYAEAGEISAQIELGRRYYQGIGMERNPAEAAAWIERAAAQGDAHAQFNIGVLYEQGIGVKRDLAKAIDWYNKSAAQNMPLSMHNLAMLYHRGEGVERNLLEVRRLLLQAAELGLVQSQFSLALVYEQGVGGPIDRVAALAWLSLAARANDEKILERLQKMSREALPADVEAARVLAVKLAQRIVETRRKQDGRDQPPPSNATAPPNMPTFSTALPPSTGTNSGTGAGKDDVAKLDATKADSGDGRPPAKATVSEVQRLLTTLKLYGGPINGSFGPLTQKAVREFQTLSGLPEDGKINDDLLVTLREVAAAAGQPKRR